MAYGTCQFEVSETSFFSEMFLALELRLVHVELKKIQSKGSNEELIVVVYYYMYVGLRTIRRLLQYW